MSHKDLYGEQSAGGAAVAADADGVDAGVGSGQGGHGCQDSAEIPARPAPAKRDAEKHEWRTRLDPFAEAWEELRERLEIEPGLQAKTLFEHLRQRQPGRVYGRAVTDAAAEDQTLARDRGSGERGVLRAEAQPGQLCQSDFTHCRELEITISGEAFPHLIYHFVLSYSNWETGSICYTESFESLSEGLQKALLDLGGVPREHRSDRMSAAVNNLTDRREFTRVSPGPLQTSGPKNPSGTSQ
jgi:hypothetical protein